MPTAEEHLQKYFHDRDCYAHGFPGGKWDFSDWKVVTLFYAALHLVEAVLADACELHGKNHQDREQLMRDHADLFSNDSRRTYNKLRSLSHKARYESVSVSAAEVGIAQDNLENLALTYRPYIEKFEKNPS